MSYVAHDSLRAHARVCMPRAEIRVETTPLLCHALPPKRYFAVRPVSVTVINNIVITHSYLALHLLSLPSATLIRGACTPELRIPIARYTR